MREITPSHLSAPSRTNVRSQLCSTLPTDSRPTYPPTNGDTAPTYFAARALAAAASGPALPRLEAATQGPPRPPKLPKRFKMLRCDLNDTLRGKPPYRLSAPVDETMAVSRTRAFLELNALLDFLSVDSDLFDEYSEQEKAEHLFMYAQGAGVGGSSIEPEHLVSIMEYLDPGAELFNDEF